MKSDKYFTLRDVNLGPKQIQSLAKEKFDQRVKQREEFEDIKRAGVTKAQEPRVKEGWKQLTYQGSEAPKSIFQHASKGGKSPSEDGLGRLGVDFEKELEMRF